MNFSVILESATVSATFTLAGAAVTYLSLWARFQAARAEVSGAAEKMALRFEKLESELASCRRLLADSEQRYAPAAESFPGPASLHFNRRGQVAQLYRRGQTPRSIASALGISQGEVKLMIKLHDLDRLAAAINSRENLGLNSSQILDKASGLDEGEA
jgi:DNA-binding NarL/FixJ family response regulator